MRNAWRIQPLDADTYRFFNISGASAEGITLRSAGQDDGETIEIAGPVDDLLGPPPVRTTSTTPLLPVTTCCIGRPVQRAQMLVTPARFVYRQL